MTLLFVQNKLYEGEKKKKIQTRLYPQFRAINGYVLLTFENVK